MHSLVRHLIDFTIPQPAAAASPLVEKRKPVASSAPAIDVEATAREAEERGRIEGAAAARAEFERLRAEDAAEFERRLAEERQRWTQNEAERLAAGVEHGFRELTEEFAERIARIVLPFVAGGVRQRAMSELDVLLAGLLARDHPPKLKITGAADLIAEVRSRLGPDVPVTYQAGSDADIRIMTDDTIFETEMRAWTTRLASASKGSGDLNG